MLKSISKKGFTLVEVVCSLSILSLIFICIFSYEVTSLNIKKNIKTINDNTLLMETLKNNIIYSMSFDDLEQLQRESKTFINNENMCLDKIRRGVSNVFSEHLCEEQPYIQLSFLKCEFKVYSLKLTLHTGKPNDKEELQCNFYKGCY